MANISHNLRLSFRRACTSRASIFLLVTLVGCAPSSETTRTGKVTFEYDGISESDVSFRLHNGADRSIYLRGARTLTLAVDPWDAGIACDAISPGGSEEDLIGFSEGTPTIFDIKPGESVRLLIRTKLPQRYKGGVCHVRLRLKDGSTVGPTDFRP
jgi:hypothetical protein